MEVEGLFRRSQPADDGARLVEPGHGVAGLHERDVVGEVLAADDVMVRAGADPHAEYQPSAGNHVNARGAILARNALWLDPEVQALPSYGAGGELEVSLAELPGL